MTTKIKQVRNVNNIETPPGITSKPTFTFETKGIILIDDVGVKKFKLQYVNGEYQVFVNPEDGKEPTENVSELFDIRIIEKTCTLFAPNNTMPSSYPVDKERNRKSPIYTNIKNVVVTTKRENHENKPSYQFDMSPAIFITGAGGFVAKSFNMVNTEKDIYKVFSTPEGTVINYDVTEYFNIEDTLRLCENEITTKAIMQTLTKTNIDEK